MKKTDYETIFKKEKLMLIADEMKKSHFKEGFDNMTAQGAEIWLEINYDNLLEQLKAGKYQPQPLLGFSVSKKNGTFRQLVKPCAVDMIIQKALKDYLTERIEPVLSPHIHSYLPNRGVTTAVKEFCVYGAKYRYVLKIDPSDFFNSIDHTVLEKALAEMEFPKAFIKLIMKFINAPVVENEKTTRHHCGIPQGIPTAPILADWYLYPLDCFLEERGLDYIRYADDVVVFGDDFDSLTALYTEISVMMKEHLHLNMNDEKCTVDIPEKISFLGYCFSKNSCGMISMESQIPSSEINHQWTSSVPEKDNRQITVISNGILSRKDFSLRFSCENGKYDIPVYGCDSINVYSDVVFDSNFLAYAAKNRITVNMFNERGKKIGAFVPNTRLISPPLTIKQLEYYGDSKKRLYLASRFVLGSVHNLRLNIRYYRKNYHDKIFTDSLSAIDTLEKLVKKCNDYNELLLLEARIRNIYYHCFDSFIRVEGFAFDKRTRRPPKNAVNAMLSFGNTVLYNLIATYIEKTALDVRVGFLHATNRRQESLNLDIAELFKPLIVDRVVFSMINKGMIDSEKHFEHQENGTVYLNSEGKHIFLRTFYDKLNTRVTVGKHTESYYTIMNNEIKKLIMYFRKEDEKYNPFKQVR